MNAPIPPSVLAQHTAVLGKTGSGKTSTVKLAVEQVVATGARVCALDPIKSDWWGLTSSADGKRPGLPFYILGGPHGHVPLHASSGKAIGELVARGELALSILDMKGFEPGGHARFFADFAATLMDRMQGVLHLVIEEAHLFAPKERTGLGAENMAIHYAKMLATAGRSIGVRLILATQRTQALHNALLGSCDTLIAHRLIAPADQGPVLKWLKANVRDQAVRDKVEASLASLPTGRGWLCSGEARIFKLVTFPRIATYDNTATPTGATGEKQEVITAQIDLDRLRSIIGEALSESEVNDPKALKAEIARLRGRLGSPAKPDGAALREAGNVGRREGFEQGKQAGFAEGFAEALRRANAAVAGVRVGEAAVADPARGEEIATPAGYSSPGSRKQEAQASARSEPAGRTSMQPVKRLAKSGTLAGKGNGAERPFFEGLGVPAQELLAEAHKRWPCRMTWVQLTSLCRRKARGGSFNAARKELLDGGRIKEVGGKVVPIACEDRPAPSAEELISLWSSALPAMTGRLFGSLVAHHPCRFTWSQLATLSNCKAAGGAFNSARRILLDNDLVREADGLVVLTIEVAGRTWSRDDLVALWKGTLPAAAAEIFTVIAGRSEPVSAETLALETGRQPRGGSWNNALALLRQNGLVVEPEKNVYALGALGGL